MSTLDCFFCFQTYQCFPTFDDITFDLSLRKISNNTVLQVLNNQLTETINRFQTTLCSRTSILKFIEKSLINRAHFAKQLVRRVAVGYNVTLEDEFLTYTIPTLDDISPAPYVLKEITCIESPAYKNVLLKEYYFRRVRILKQIGVFTSLMVTTLVPTILPELLHHFITTGEIHELDKICSIYNEKEIQTSEN